jgi:hypothetical protein
MVAMLLVACGAGAAATAAASDQWWPLILTLHLAAAAVLTGFGLRHQRVNRPQREP